MNRILLMIVGVTSLEFLISPYDSHSLNSSKNLIHSLQSAVLEKSPHTFLLSSDEPYHYFTSATEGISRTCALLSSCQEFLNLAAPSTSLLTTSSNPSFPATLYLYERQAQFRVDTQLELRFEHLVISGMKWLSDECNEAYCTHCHHLDDIRCVNDDKCITIEGHSIDDRNEFIKIYGTDACNHKELEFFMRMNNKDAQVVFKNVQFRDIRMRLNGLINVVSGNLMLDNVDFINVEPGNYSLPYYTGNPLKEKESTGVITSGVLTSCADPDSYASITYDTGLITGLNTGYSSKSPAMPLNGLMSFRNLKSLVLRNITIENNLCFASKFETVLKGKYNLIGVWNSYNVLFESCRFVNNVSQDGVLYGKYAEYDQNAKFVISECEIIDNTTEDILPTIKILYFPQVVIDKTYYRGHDSKISPAIYIEAAQLKLSQSKLTNSREALKFTYMLNTELKTILDILDTEFILNTSRDHAADLNIFGNYKDILHINILNSNFTSTSSSCGSIYMDSSVKLPQSSQPALIEGVIFQDIFLSNLYGTITTSHSEGILKIYRSSFLSITGTDSSSFIARLEHASNAHSLDDLLPETYVILKECIIKDNIGRYGLYSSLFSPYSDLITESCIFLNNTAQLIWSEANQYYDIGSTFMLNTYQENSVYSGYFSSSAVFTNTIITNNRVVDNGLVLVEQNSHLKLNNVTFSHNVSGTIACAISIGKLASAQIDNSIFFNNTSRYGSSLYISSTTQGVYVNNTEFGYNYGGSVIYLISSKLTMSNCIIHHSVSKLFAVGINTHISELNLYNVTMRDNAAPYGCFLFAQDSSVVNINSSLFENSENVIGGSIYLEGSKLYMKNSKMRNVRGGKSTLLLGVSMCEIHLNSCSIYNITTTSYYGDAIMHFLYARVINITDSAIDRFNNQAIYSKESFYFLMFNTTISNGKAVNFSGGAIQVEKNEIQFEISSCLFINITAEYAAGLYLDGRTSAFSVRKSRFENLTAEGGAAIVTKNHKVDVSECSFVDNSLIKSGKDVNMMEGKGGAVILLCPEEECMSSVKDCHFESNRASSGGAIYWNNIEPAMTNNTFKDNQAIYGQDIASSSNHIELLPNSSISFIRNNAAASGQYVPRFQTALVDIYGQIVKTDNTSICIIKGKGSTLISGDASYIAYQGIFTIDSLAVIKEPGTLGQITISSAVYSKSSGRLRDSESIVLTFDMRHCAYGEIITEDNRCMICPPNTYSVTLNSTYCELCPSNAICKGGIEMYPNQKYWRSGVYSDLFLKCPNEESCLGHDNFRNLTGKCLEGYKGNLCQPCEVNWSRTMENKCQKCPDDASNVLRLIGTASAIIIAVIFMTRKSINCSDKPKELHTIYLRNLTNYMQTLSIIVMLNLPWPDYVRGFIGLQESYSDLSPQLLSIDCFLSVQNSIIDVIYLKVIIYTILPYIIIIISVLFWGTLSIYYRSTSYMKKELRSTVIVLLFLMSPILIVNYLSLLACMEIDPGEYYLVQDLDIRCWDSTHSFYAFTFCVPGVLIWSIGMPSLGLFLLIKNRKKLHTSEIKINYGFLYSGYRTETFYWEFIMLGRKIMITFIVTLCSTISTNLQAISASVILIVAYIAQIKFKPYQISELNSLEEKCILVSGITVYCGLYFLSGDLNKHVKVILFIIMIVANCYYLGVWIKGAINSCMLKFLDSNPRVFRKILKCFPKYRYLLYEKECSEENFQVHLKSLEEAQTTRRGFRGLTSDSDILNEVISEPLSKSLGSLKIEAEKLEDCFQSSKDLYMRVVSYKNEPTLLTERAQTYQNYSYWKRFSL